MVKGGPNGAGPTIAALAAATPKINTGTVSGNTSTASSKPPRRQRNRQCRADQTEERQCRCAGSKVSASQPAACNSTLSINPSSGAINHERQSGGDPMRDRLALLPPSSSGIPSHHQEVERAVVVVGREQSIERKQTSQQRTKPKNCRPNPREQCEVRADGERRS